MRQLTVYEFLRKIGENEEVHICISGKATRKVTLHEIENYKDDIEDGEYLDSLLERTVVRVDFRDDTIYCE